MAWKRMTLIALAMLIAGCDRKTAPLATAPRVKVYTLELRPLTPLLPSRPTHVAVDSIGNVYWSQETETGDDIVFVIGEGGVPRATQLTSANVLALADLAGGSGNIQSITAGPDDGIYFYFVGSKGRRGESLVGRFDLKTSDVRILADTDKLMSATGMGRSLGLARGKMIASGPWIWMWIRHTDDAALLRFDGRALGKAKQVEPLSPFKRTAPGLPMGVTRLEDDLSSGKDGSFLWMSPGAGEVRRISPSGESTIVQMLGGIPSALSTPAIDKAGRLLIFAADAPLLPPRAGGGAPANVQYPALLIYEGANVSAIGSNDILAYSGFHLPTVRMAELVLEPSGDFISYDASTGELMRLRIKERLG